MGARNRLTQSTDRRLVMYLLVRVISRLGGRRTLAQVTTFGFVLLLIIAETMQQAPIGPDYSIANAGLLAGSASA